MAHIWQWFMGHKFGLRGLSSDYQQWIYQNLLDTTMDLWWPTKFCIIIWWAWKWRNAACFATTSVIPGDKIQFLLKQFDTIIGALSGNNYSVVAQPRHQCEILVSWSPQPDGWILLNTDGAAKGNPGPAGGGGVFRDTRGNWICGFAEGMGRCTSVRAELKAILRGLQVARDQGFWHL